MERLLVIAEREDSPPLEELARSLFYVSLLSMYLNDLDHAATRARASLALYEQLEDQLNIGRVLNNLGNISLQAGDHPGAERHYRASLALSRAINHTRGMAVTLNNLAEIERWKENLVASQVAYDESLALYQQLGDHIAAASVMGHMATLVLQQGQYERAQQLYQASSAMHTNSATSRGSGRPSTAWAWSPTSSSTTARRSGSTDKAGRSLSTLDMLELRGSACCTLRRSTRLKGAQSVRPCCLALSPRSINPSASHTTRARPGSSMST
ncbi:tetratricopeptide repeat protein [Candidatus Gracilibacteria bacterium]|nr:tetratricopeptide repeat protein [Candidatus Gracilibacteria bacterium]